MIVDSSPMESTGGGGGGAMTPFAAPQKMAAAAGVQIEPSEVGPPKKGTKFSRSMVPGATRSTRRPVF